MKEYTKPIVLENEELAESVYAASGDTPETVRKCRFGREEANPGSDKCQACSFSGGIRNEELPDEPLFEKDFKECPDNMPLKQ